MLKIIEDRPICSTLRNRKIRRQVDLSIFANPRLDSNEFCDVTGDAAF